MSRRGQGRIQPDADDVALGDLVEEVAGASVPPLLDDDPNPKFAPRMRFYVFDALRAARRAIRFQTLADSKAAAMEHRASAARLRREADLGETRIAAYDLQIATLNQLINKAYTMLGSWTGRAWWDTRRKLAFWAILLVADTGTIAGIAYGVGEELYLAIPLGLGVGASAITMGLLASDHRKHKERARRASSRPKDSEEFAGFFVADVRRSYLQVVFGAMFAVLLAGVLTLRVGASGDPVLGIGFGLVAAASFLASWVSCWYHTCEISDFLDGLWRKCDALAAKQDPEVLRIGTHNAATSMADSLEEIGRLTGDAGAEAAAARVIARGPMENPAIYGHGTPIPPTPPSPAPSTNGHRPRTIEEDEVTNFLRGDFRKS